MQQCSGGSRCCVVQWSLCSTVVLVAQWLLCGAVIGAVVVAVLIIGAVAVAQFIGGFRCAVQCLLYNVAVERHRRAVVQTYSVVVVMD